MTFYQGNLDGLCGPYAIANALELCGFSNEDYFQTACCGLADSRWPTTLWEGTTIGDLQRMISHCRNEHSELQRVNVKYPFQREPPRTNEAYWKRFHRIFDSDYYDVKCGIVGMVQPKLHWIVIRREGRTLEFVDSHPKDTEIRKYNKCLYAGIRAPSKNHWIFQRDELITFSLVP